MTEQPSGSCLCQSIRYRIETPFQMTVLCHCNRCKKITGGAFEALTLVEENTLTFTCGKELLTNYRISELSSKNFCSKCGTPIYNLHAKLPGKALIHIGSLDDPTIVSPTVNIFCESMLPWVKDIGSLKSFPREFGS